MLIDNEKDLDEELAKVQSKNKGHGYDEPKSEPEKKPAGGGTDDKGKGGDTGTDVEDDDKGGGGEEPPKEPDKKGNEGEEEPPRSPEEDVEPPQRSERHIPIGQYKDEKREWKQDAAFVKQAQEVLGTSSRDETLKRLGELTKTAKKPEENKKEITDKTAALRAYAEKYNLEEASVVELADILGSGQTLTAEDRVKLDAAAKIEQDRKEAEYFENEWSNQALPVISRKWPNATPEQKAKARQLLDDISHSKGFSRTPLPMILSGYEDAEGKNPFTAIFGDQGGEPAKAGKRTMEVGKPGASKASTGLTAKDLNSAKADKLTGLFDELESMPDDEKGKIVSDLDPITYDRYVRFLGTRELDQGIQVNRDGRKVVLK